MSTRHPTHPTNTAARPPWIVLLAVGFSVFVAADDLTVVSTMLRPIIADIGLVLPDGLNDAAWVVNAYLIAFVSVMPIAGRISDAIGRRTTFVIAYGLFLAGTTLVPIAPSLPAPLQWLLIGRVLTALGGGAMVPVALAVVADVYTVGPRSRALGTLGAIETLGWVWGPLYGAMLVRFLSWEWQFWLNIPLALVGLAAVWWALDGLDQHRRTRIDWVGAGLLTAGLVSINVALLNGAQIQSVNGLEELTGQRRSTDWLYIVAAAAFIGFVWWQRRQRDPLIDTSILRGRNVVLALVINLVIGVGLIVAMVDVPLFVNAVELNLARAAVLSGWILSALTAAMAVASYVGGRITERAWYRPPALIGVSIAAGTYAWMGGTWHAGSSFGLFAAQLALLGIGVGLTVAPTTSAVVDAAPPQDRGSAAGLVMLVRLLGLSLGLSTLTAWALHRFNVLRATIELPPIGSPGFEDAVLTAQRNLTAAAIADTFTAAAVVVAVGVAAALAMRRRNATARSDAADDDHDVPIRTGLGRTGLGRTGFGRTGSDPTAPGPRVPNFPVSKGVPMEPHDGPRSHRGDQRPAPEVPVTDPTAANPPVTDPPGANPTVANPTVADVSPVDGPVGTAPVVGVAGREPGPVELGDRIDALQRRTNLIVGALGIILFASLGLILILIGRVNQANSDAEAARAEAAQAQAGAALYASQIEGFQTQITALQPEIDEGVTAAIAGLREFGDSVLEFPVKIDTTVDLDTEVVINRTVDVPIKLDVPINQTFDTTIQIDTPVGQVPLDVSVPVNIVIPIDETVQIPIDETVPVKQSVPVKLDVPVKIDVGETELSTLTESIAKGLETLQGMIDGFGTNTGAPPTTTP